VAAHWPNRINNAQPDAVPPRWFGGEGLVCIMIFGCGRGGRRGERPGLARGGQRGCAISLFFGAGRPAWVCGWAGADSPLAWGLAMRWGCSIVMVLALGAGVVVVVVVVTGPHLQPKPVSCGLGRVVWRALLSCCVCGRASELALGEVSYCRQSQPRIPEAL
jgi:hypothetical protein